MTKRLLTTAVIICAAMVVPALAQSPCKVGVEAPPVGFWTWTPKSEISIYVLAGDFSDGEVQYLLAPLASWNAVSEATASNVRFEYKGTINTPLHCENCLTIKRGQVFDKSNRHLTELQTYSAERNQIMTWANIVIDPRLTTPKTLTNAMAHELGHSFGLLDCYSCKQGSTVMIQFKGVNVSNEMNGPSGCDVAQVKRVYELVAAQLKRASRAKTVAMDEGEKPVEDDTPVIVPKP
ncbi:MAG TPA: hypothetical protein VJ875_24350 [Pyrinomonadaceae bacterium]|nr:hypothetical protein [Pyrinomonadaceae bacterium]